MQWKPKNYSTVSPYLIVRDAEATLQFLENVFGASRLRVHVRENGLGIAHAEALIDDSVVMMGEMPEAGEANVHVYVRNADAVFDRAINAGAQIVQEMTRSGDGDYRGGVADGNGTVWWISTQESYQE